MKYLSVCSGIEAASVAWHGLGWQPVGFSEIEPFPSAVLAHRFPNTPNYGDMTQHAAWPIEPGSIDLLVGGTPCQSFSVAGLRAGLADPRGGLMLTYLEIAQRLRPKWVVWENVPGVLSSAGGRDFGSFLGALGELGYGWAYRVLDAQWCRTHGHPRAVPQRRRRVFVVGHLGDWERASQVLLESQSVQRDYPKKRKAAKNIAADAEAGAGCGGWMPNNPGVVSSVCTKWAKGTGGPSGSEHFNLLAQPVAGTLGNLGITVEETWPIQRCNTPAVAFTTEQTPKFRDECALTLTRQSPTGGGQPQAVACPTLTAHNDPSRSPQSSEVTQQVAPVHAASMTVRRLTPRECERLQGFPDDYTAIPWRGKAADQCPDGPRYKALGNSMAVNCMEWIGERIDMIEKRNSPGV